MKIQQRLNLIRYYNYSHLKKELLFYFKVILIVVLLIFILTGVIRIHFIFNSTEGNLLFTLLNSLVWGGYLSAIGFFNKGVQSENKRLILLVAIILLFILGLGFFDVVFEIRVFFYYPYFCVSSYHGINFFWQNWYIWIIIFSISISLEREV